MRNRDGDYWSGLAQDGYEAEQVRHVVEQLASEVTQQAPDMGNIRGLVAALEDRLLVQPIQGDSAPF